MYFLYIELIYILLKLFIKFILNQNLYFITILIIDSIFSISVLFLNVLLFQFTKSYRNLVLYNLLSLTIINIL